MVKTFLSFLTVICWLLLALPAAARFPDQGSAAIALERAFGIHFDHAKEETPGADISERNVTTIGLGWDASDSSYHQARAAFDYFVIDQLSVGGSLAFFSVSEGDSDSSGLLFAPRVGFALPLASWIVFWPRGGLTYYSVGSGPKHNQFALSGEATFAFLPTPHWAILLSPGFDLGLAGSHGENDYSDRSFSLVSVGIAGLL